MMIYDIALPPCEGINDFNGSLLWDQFVSVSVGFRFLILVWY